MTERDFHLERFMERALELKAKHQSDHATYLVELTKVLTQTARNEAERRRWEELMKVNKFFQRLSQDDEREEVIKQVRATLKASQPFVKFWVVREGPRSSRRWEVRWTNGPTEGEIKQLVAPFAREDLTFRYLRKNEAEAQR
jgi:hypothetical protein